MFFTWLGKIKSGPKKNGHTYVIVHAQIVSSVECNFFTLMYEKTRECSLKSDISIRPCNKRTNVI